MSKLTILVFSLIGLFSVCLGQVIQDGQCDPNIELENNFDINEFLGTWYQIESYETSNSKGSCVKVEYTWGDGRINVLNSQVVDQKIVTINGHASISSTDNSAKLTVEFNIDGSPTSQELWILSTDYKNYAVAYSCENDVTNDQRRVYSWILSRRRQLSPDVRGAIYAAIWQYLDLNPMYYQVTDQSDAGCFSYPDRTLPPVQFRGQCQSNEPKVMQDFEAEKFLGRWHIVEMYPSPFQDGSCGNVFYQIRDGNGAGIYSQVKDWRLETVAAVVVPAEDGSAKLAVTVDGSNTTIEYWILDTDYINYALVYTCQNINEDAMQVGSWKLSRLRWLEVDSFMAIDKIMFEVPYLDNRYFIAVDQTVGGCFYFPEPEENVGVSGQ